MKTFLIILSILFWTAMDIFLWSEKYFIAAIIIILGILLFTKMVSLSNKMISRRDKYKLSEWQLIGKQIAWANGIMVILLLIGAALSGAFKAMG